MSHQAPSTGLSSQLVSELLHQHALKHTICRESLLQVLAGQKSPVTADELLLLINTGANRLHRATLYRDITTFVKAGIVNELVFQGVSAHYYEFVSGRHHHHFRCEICGRIEDIELPEVEAALELASLADTQKQITKHSLKFYGYCSDCQS